MHTPPKWWSSQVSLTSICLLIAAASAHGIEPGRSHPTVGLYSGQVDTAIECGADVLMPSIDWHTPPGYMKSVTERAHAAGIRMYPSLAVAYDGYEDRRHAFAEANPQYWEKRRDGRLIDSGTQVGLTFGSPEVRAYKVKAFVDLVEKTGIDGILLDYCRFFGNTTGYHDLIVSAFEKETGRDPYEIPTDDSQWIRFRAGYVTQFVVELREALDARFGAGSSLGEHRRDAGATPTGETPVPHRATPTGETPVPHPPRRVKLIACVNPDPEECLKSSMQDWATWLDRGLIDGVVTMIYERDTNDTLQKVMIANQTIRGRVPHMPMIAPYGGNLTTPELLREASHKCLVAGTGAVAFYRDDSIRELDLWDAIREVAHWDLAEVQRWPVNYVLNSGFENELENWAVGEGEGVAIASSAGRAGSECLQMSFPGRRAVRQIIDRGFLPGQRSLHVSAWFREAGLPEGTEYAIEINTNRKGGKESFYRIPVQAQGKGGWRRVEAHMPIGRSEDLRFILLGITAETAGGTLYADDVAVHLTEKPAEGRAVQAASLPRSTGTGGINIVRGQPVKGSSFWENGFDYANAVNGDLSNENYGKGAAWHSQRPAKDQWITIYLPTIHTISRVRLLNSSAQAAYRTLEYKLDVSIDDHTWRQVAAGRLPDDGETWTEVEFPPTEAKYIRFTGVTGYHLEYAVGLKEIEVY